MGASTVTRAIRKLVGSARTLVVERSMPRCVSMPVRSEQEVRIAAERLSHGSVHGAVVLQGLLRGLVELNSPALFLHVRSERRPLQVILRPWGGRCIRFRGSSFLVEAGAEAPEGIEAFSLAPFSHVTQLYPTTPDHPVHVISIEHQDQSVITGDLPPYVTHVSIIVNGKLLACGERLLHERGPQVWAAA